MANYFGKSPLEMRCPHCGAYAPHRVTKTFREQYKWSDETTRLFEMISGSDISFRKRQKQCASCGRSFFSVEMSRHYLSDLIEHVLRLEKEWESFREEIGQRKEEAKQLKALVKRVNELTRQGSRR